MLRGDEQNAPHACKFGVFDHCACFGMFGNERKRSKELIAKEIRSFGAVAPPPTRLVADLTRSKRRGPYAQCHWLFRFVEFREQIVGVDELTTIGLSDRLKQQAFLFRREM
jgi:hypothetical protein